MASGKAIDQTAAGCEVDAEKEKRMAKTREEMRQLQEAWKEAQKVRDVEAPQELAALNADLEAKMKEQEDREWMRVNLKHPRNQRDAELKRERERDAAHARQLEPVRELAQREVETEKSRAASELEKMTARANLEKERADLKEAAAKWEVQNAELRASQAAEMRPKTK